MLPARFCVLQESFLPHPKSTIRICPPPPKPLTTPRSLPPTDPKEASFTEGRAQRIDVGQFLWVLLLVWIGKEEAVRDTR